MLCLLSVCRTLVGVSTSRGPQNGPKYDMMLLIMIKNSDPFC